MVVEIRAMTRQGPRRTRPETDVPPLSGRRRDRPFLARRLNVLDSGLLQTAPPASSPSASPAPGLAPASGDGRRGGALDPDGLLLEKMGRLCRA